MNNIHEEFGMESFRPEDEVINNSQILDELEYAKANLRALIDRTIDLVPVAIRVAKDSESPRSIEVVSILAKNISEMNKDLIGLIPKENDDQDDVKHITNNNSLFIGSTEDLFSMMRGLDVKQPEKIINKELN
jgi:hypothetical protein